MTNKDYEENMKETMVNVAGFISADNPKERHRKSIYFAFANEAEGVHIGDLSVFKNQFQIEQAGIHLPDCLWQIGKLSVQIAKPQKPFYFGLRDIREAAKIVKSSLEKEVPELKVYLKRFQLQEAFQPDEKEDKRRIYMFKLFKKEADKLNQTIEMSQLNNKLTKHLNKKFRKY